MPPELPPGPSPLPPGALVRVGQICRRPGKNGEPDRPGLLPIVPRTWYAWVANGTAPPGRKLGKHTTVWPVEQVLALGSAMALGRPAKVTEPAVGASAHTEAAQSHRGAIQPTRGSSAELPSIMASRHLTCVAPLVLRADAAAAAVGLGVELFERQVRVGACPKPRRLGDGSVGWLYRELVAYVETLPVCHSVKL